MIPADRGAAAVAPLFLLSVRIVFSLRLAPVDHSQPGELGGAGCRWLWPRPFASQGPPFHSCSLAKAFSFFLFLKKEASTHPLLQRCLPSSSLCTTPGLSLSTYSAPGSIISLGEEGEAQRGIAICLQYVFISSAQGIGTFPPNRLPNVQNPV